jgi:hypothetical protein
MDWDGCNDAIGGQECPKSSPPLWNTPTARAMGMAPFASEVFAVMGLTTVKFPRNATWNIKKNNGVHGWA